MARWKQAFDTHNVHQTLRVAEALIDNVLIDAKPDATDELRRMRKVADHFQIALKKVDPETLPMPWLDEIDSAFADYPFGNHLRDYINSFDVQHLINANEHISSHSLHHMHNLRSHYRIGAKETPIRGLEGLVTALTKQMRTSIEELQETKNQLKQETSNLQSQRDRFVHDATQKLDEIKTTLSTINDQFRAEQGERVQEFSTDQRQRKEEFSSQQIARNEKFTEDQQLRIETHNEWVKSLQSSANLDIKKLIKELETHLVSVKNRVNTDTGEIIEIATGKLLEIKELYGLVGDVSLSGSSLENAREEQIASWIWSVLVIVFVALTAWWGYRTYGNGSFYFTDPALLTFELIKASSVTAILLFGAVYSGRQAKNHNQNSKRLRWLGLQMTAISPFVADFDATTKEKFKDRIGEKLFGSHPEDAALLNKSDKLPIGLRTKLIEVIRDSKYPP